MLPPVDTVSEKATNGSGKSVQAREQGDAVFNTPGFISSFIFPIAQMADTVPAWGYYPYIRDKFLRAFWKTERLFAGATYSMTAFASSLDLMIDGLPRAKKYAQMVINDCENGRGYRMLVAKSAVDMFTTDNGFFWELVGSGRADKPLRGPLQPPYVLHLDSVNCWRTLDEEYPVIYINPLKNTFHRLHYTRVISRSSMPQPDELARGIGFCPTSRILRDTQRIRDILIYQHEKVAGKFTRALGFLHGMNSFELGQALEATNEQAESLGLARYKGIPFFGKAGQEVGAEIVDLASIGDGYDEQKVLTTYMYAVALAYGVDAREFWPATASGATKADASIQDMKTQGKGKGDIIETLLSAWRDAFPETVEAKYDFTDDEQDMRRAQIYGAHATTYNSIKAAGTIDAEEERAHLVKEGVLDPALLKATTPEQANAEPVSADTPIEDEAVETPSAGGAPKIEGQGDKPSQDNPQDEQANRKEFAVWDVKKKELQATRLDFENAFNNILEGSKAGDYTRAQAQRLLYRLIQRKGTQGYIDGLSDGGVEIADSSELERDDLRTINGMLGEQSVYVSDFIGTVFDGDVSDTVLEGKAAQWFNGSILPFYQAGLQASGANPMVEFAGDDGVHSCDDCQRLQGQRHRLRDWVDRGFDPPNGINLDCHDGHQCKHTLVRVRSRERGNW